MAYNFIKQRLENNDTIILDGAIGAELEKKGAKIFKTKCSQFQISDFYAYLLYSDWQVR